METPSEENTKFVVDFLSLFPPSSEPSSDRKEKDWAPPISGRTLRNGQIKISSNAATASSYRANKLCHSQSILIKRFSVQKTEEKKKQLSFLHLFLEEAHSVNT